MAYLPPIYGMIGAQDTTRQKNMSVIYWRNGVAWKLC